MVQLQFFIGSCDKSDLLIPASLLMLQLNRRILLVDAMSSPWLHYQTGAWSKEQKWSNWHGLDTVSGIESWEELEHLADKEGVSLDEYDDIWVDIDRITVCEPERLIHAHARFLVQSIDQVSMQRNMEWLNTFYLQHDSKLERMLQYVILHSITEEQDRRYVEQMLMSGGYSSRDQSIVVLYDERNWNARLWNETHEYKYLTQYSKSMKASWRNLIESTVGELSDRTWKQAIKMSTKGHWLDEAM